jgi:predicted thioesterase
VPRTPSDPAAPDAWLGVGLSGTVELEVTEADTAGALRTGDVPVLATPRLIALCEEASCRALDGRVLPGGTSVATRVRFDHRAPVAVGSRVTAEATLVRVEGRRLTFNLLASLRADAVFDLIGAGRLTRVLVDRQAFLARADRGAGWPAGADPGGLPGADPGVAAGV